MRDRHDITLSGTVIEDAIQWMESVDGHDITVATPESLALYDQLLAGQAQCRAQTPIWGQTCADLVLTGAQSALLLNIVGRPR